MQARLHRAQRAAKDRCNLVQRRTREEAEFHDEAMLFRQARHRSADPLRIFRRLRGAIGRARSRWHLAKGIGFGKPGGVVASPAF